ncbi:hypothetical protein ACJJTC_003564 [Scirpophaga incertulas]
MKCINCSATFGNFQKYCFHLQFCYKTNDYYPCSSEGCDRVYNKKRSLKRHFQLVHSELNLNNVDTSNSLLNNDNNDTLLYNKDLPHTSQDSVDLHDSDFEIFLKELINSFVAKLYDRLNLSRTFIQKIIESVKQMIKDIASKLMLIITQKSDIKTEVALLCNCFSHLDTEYKRLQYFERSDKYVKPISKVISSSQEKAKNNNSTVMVMKNKKICVLPIKDNLRLFLESPGVYDTIIKYQTELSNEKDVIRNVVQGKMWYDLHEKHRIPLIVYFDDLETGNPLGSHSGKNKIGVVYISVALIPPEYSSRLENIFLATLFYSNDRNLVGNKAIFESLIKDLNMLYDEGININVNESIKTVKFAVACVAGDNLGIHSVMGFHESFASSHYCRFCLLSKQECQLQLSSNDNAKRNLVNYEDDVTKCRGLKEKCVWNEIKEFHVYKNLYCDVMHDFCEGIHRYGMALVINKLIGEKIFTLEQLNQRIKYFDFNSSNPPPLITKSHLQHGSIVFSASEMMCLVRNFQFLVGDLVPCEHLIWLYYVCMLELTNVVMAQAFSSDLLQYLESLICEHHERYIEIFGALKPKHHFVTHYPDVIARMGPLILISTFKYESKHLDLKRVSNSINTQRNVPLSLAIKCQLQCCYRFLSQKGLPDNLDHGKVKGVQMLSVCNDDDTTFNKVKWITFNGIKYSVGDFLAYDYDNCEPYFCKIDNLLLNKENPLDFYIYTSIFKTCYYDYHYQSFVVEEVHNKYSLLRLNDCFNIIPLKMHTISGTNYIHCYE